MIDHWHMCNAERWHIRPLLLWCREYWWMLAQNGTLAHSTSCHVAFVDFSTIQISTSSSFITQNPNTEYLFDTSMMIAYGNCDMIVNVARCAKSLPTNFLSVCMLPYSITSPPCSAFYCSWLSLSLQEGSLINSWKLCANCHKLHWNREAVSRIFRSIIQAQVEHVHHLHPTPHSTRYQTTAASSSPSTSLLLQLDIPAGDLEWTLKYANIPILFSAHAAVERCSGATKASQELKDLHNQFEESLKGGKYQDLNAQTTKLKERWKNVKQMARSVSWINLIPTAVNHQSRCLLLRHQFVVRRLLKGNCS